MEIWQQILLMTFTPTAAVAVLAYILRKFFDRGLDRDIERYKSDLQLQRFEYQTKYSTIHLRRAEVIGEFYKLLVRAIEEVAELVKLLRFADSEPLPDKKQRAADYCNEMMRYFKQHRLYFDEGICKKIEKLIESLRMSFVEFDLAQPGEKIEHSLETDPDMWKSAYKRIKEEVDPIRQELERQFRSLLEAKQEA